MSSARPAVGYASTVAAAGLFGVNGTVSTLALAAGIAPTNLTALRCTGAALVLVLSLAVAAPGRLRIHWREAPLVAVFGVVGIALTQFLYYVAIGRLPVGIALVFEMTAPVFIALYVRLVRREQVRGRLWVALALSLSGLVLVAQVWQGGGSLDGLGVLAERVPVSLGSVQVPLWVLVAWIVVLGAAAPFWLSLAALRHLPPTTAGIVATVEPVFASVVAWLWVEQVLTPWQVAGGVVVLAGIVLAQTARTATSAAVPETVPS